MGVWKLGPRTVATLALVVPFALVPGSLLLASFASNVVLASTSAPWKHANYLAAWIVAQWMPLPSIRRGLLVQSWNYWEELYLKDDGRPHPKQPVPSVNVQDFRGNDNDAALLLEHLERTYGPDWRKRPLLLRNLWSQEELNDPSRRLSVQGLLKEKDLIIPYFTDARRKNALTPDDRGSVGDIVANMTQHKYPHKIGTQFVVQEYPELIEEIAPTQLLTTLFGSYFTADHVRPSGPWDLLPPLTTVPLFVAPSKTAGDSTRDSAAAQPYTALHCEPIGNIAVQLSGSKQWTLVDPAFSFLIRPTASPDGRAFFASFQHDEQFELIPRYTPTTTYAGDAMWVPTWTWHRVDYTTAHDDKEEQDLAIGGSLFHFRPYDFVVNNPLFAVLMIPSMVLELVGYNTQ